MKPTSREADKKSSDYRLEQSYFAWLDAAGRGPEFVVLDSVRNRHRPNRPFADRVHDWTFGSNPEMQETLEKSHWNLDPALENVLWLFDTEGKLPEWLAMSAAAFAYGGLHLLAWNAPFHAPIYGLLWKISGITTASLIASPILELLAGLFYYLFDPDLDYHWEPGSMPPNCLALIGWMLTSLVTLLFPPAYGLARVYLVVESFLSLAYLPESVLVTPNFSLYFPHVG
jgi:hypothetical protein